MEFRRNRWRLAALFIMAICLYSAWTMHSSQEEQLTNQDFIRFHVIANSDSEADQALKLKVRDGLLEKINGELVVEAVAQADASDAGASLTLEQSRAYIQSHLSEIEEAAEVIVQQEGYDYSVTAQLGARFVPQKTYGSVVFPAGNYEALNVTIGEGSGQNWWCVLYPPLCLIGAEAPEEMAADPLMAGAQLEPKYRLLMEAEQQKKQTTLKLEFKTLNYMKQIN